MECLLHIIGPHIQKDPSRRPDYIDPKQRLCVTLRYIFGGMSQSAIATSYAMSKVTVGRVILETSGVLWDLMRQQYLKSPATGQEWEDN